jgi:uncharacterized membrane protein YfcA
MDIVVQLVLIGVVALFVAILGNIAGFGGGVFLVPLLILVFDVEGAIAVTSVLIAMIIPELIGTLGAWRRNEVDFKLGIVFGVPSAIGAFVGALSLAQIPDIVIVVFISVVAGIFGLRIIFVTARENRNNNEDEDCDPKDLAISMRIWNKINSIKPVLKLSRNGETTDVSLPTAAFIGLSVGVLAGLFGVGGGWIQVPIFIIFFCLDPLLASGTSLFIIVIKAFASSITYIASGAITIDWWIILALVVGMSIGALIGNWLKGVIKIKFISYIVGSALIFIVVSTIITAVLGYI